MEFLIRKLLRGQGCVYHHLHKILNLVVLVTWTLPTIFSDVSMGMTLRLTKSERKWLKIFSPIGWAQNIPKAFHLDNSLNLKYSTLMMRWVKNCRRESRTGIGPWIMGHDSWPMIYIRRYPKLHYKFRSQGQAYRGWSIRVAKVRRIDSFLVSVLQRE